MVTLNDLAAVSILHSLRQHRHSKNSNFSIGCICGQMLVRSAFNRAANGQRMCKEIKNGRTRRRPANIFPNSDGSGQRVVDAFASVDQTFDGGD